MVSPQLEKVQEFLTCSICTDIYTDPCTLRCQHTFCRKCVTDYTKTRPEALQTKTIPCPSCRQVTKVPDPTRPVEEWAKQIKPSIIILGLIDTSQADPTTTGAGRFCNVCEHLGETTPATSWCPECEVAMCVRCTKTHHASPASHDHSVCDLSGEVQIRKRRKDVCPEHKKNCIEFHCKDCNKSACHKCCVLYHRACKSVLDIESMKQEMRSAMEIKRDLLSMKMEQNSEVIERRKAAIDMALQNKRIIQSTIQSTSQMVINTIKEKEKELTDKLDQVTETQLSQLQADLKKEEIEIQMCRQHYEFIGQAVNSERLMDMYDVYLACESGALVLEQGSDTDQNKTEQIVNISLTQDPDTVLTNLKLGEIDVTYESRDVLSFPLLLNTTDITTRNDKKNPGPWDLTVLEVDGLQTVVVTDWNNNCIKSLYTRNGQLYHSRLALNSIPWGVTQLKENQVMVTVPFSNQIVTVKVTPDLVKLSTIKTKKTYYCLAVLSKLSLAAGWNYSVDILTMRGRVLRSITHHNNVQLFCCPYFMCVNNDGNLLVSDCVMKSVICLTSQGDVLWQYFPKGTKSLRDPFGITTRSNGDVLLADRHTGKVIQLTDKGTYARDMFTSTNRLVHPRGIFCDGDSLFVCDDTVIQEYKKMWTLMN